MDTQPQLETVDPRDGPTKEFGQHHDVIPRAGTTTGKRVRCRLEKLLLDGHIIPQQSDAGRRFAWSYVSASTVKRRILGHLETLVGHYADVDRRRGRSTTAGTRAEALRRFEPPDRADAELVEHANSR